MKKPTLKQHVRPKFEQFLKENPGGLPAKKLKLMLYQESQAAGYSSPPHTLGAMLSIFTNEEPSKFGKIREKGLGPIYYYKDPEQADAEQTSEPNVAATSLTKRKEEVFYKSFAEYLEYAEKDSDDDRLDECTRAIAWGGSKSGGKWGTPDVVGIFSPERNAYVQFTDEIVSAEIKTDKSPQSLIVAFGQACVYRLFSHKIYLVVPRAGQSSRLKSLCHLFGLGLVYFDPETENIDSSIYEVELLAQRHSPDMYYVNEFINGDLGKKLYGRR